MLCTGDQSIFLIPDGQHAPYHVVPELQDMGSTRPQPGSCRAGGVVHMLSVTGARVPVRLEIKTVDSTQNQTADEHSRMHIVKVGTMLRDDS